MRDVITRDSCNGLVLDMFRTFVEPLEAEFGIKSNHRVGPLLRRRQEPGVHTTASRRSTSRWRTTTASRRANLESADVILVGVSRSGKTPTSLYLAMQHGIKAANYPLIPEDFERGQLPTSLAPHKRKCFGLTIDPERLAQIRHERRPDGRYAALDNCRMEVREAEAMMRREGISWLCSTHKSIEEIATTILRDSAPID